MITLLIFWGSYIGGSIMALFRNPAYAFAVYQAIYFLYPQQRWWRHMVPNFSYSFTTVVLMAVVLLVYFKRHNENKLLASPHFRWMYFVGAAYFAATFWAFVPHLHNIALTYFIKLIIIMSIAYKLIDSHERLKIALYGYIFGSWYISYLTFQVGRNAGDRVQGIGTVDSPESNGIAAAIAPALMFCLYYFWTSEKLVKKGIFVLAGAFIANGLVLINSRGAFLAVVVGAAYFMFHMFFSSFQRRFQKATVIAICLGGLAGAAVIVDASFIERIKTMQNTEVDKSKETGATRIEFWKAAFNMSLDHPAGAGYRTFNILADFYIPKDINTGGHRARAVHSTWFEVLTEMGYHGLLFFILMLWACYKGNKKARAVLRRQNKVDAYFLVFAIEAALITYLVAVTFLNRSRAEILYWLVLFCAVAYNIYYLKNKDADNVSNRTSDNGVITNPT